MSLYNLLHGFNPFAPALLAMLDIDQHECGRFRDCFLDDSDGELRIAIYTRNGGGNREQYQDCIDALARKDGYISDRDDDYDYTYATIWFRVPEKFAEICKQWAMMGGVQNPQEMFEATMNTIRRASDADPEWLRIKGVFAPLLTQITEAIGPTEARADQRKDA